MPYRTQVNADSVQSLSQKTMVAPTLTDATFVQTGLSACTILDPLVLPLSLVSKQYVDTLSPVEFSAGDVLLTIKTIPTTGWIMMDDLSIGNSSSGATGRANDDTADLFAVFWNNILDAWCPVSGGRGASAAADFTAGKTLTLPRTLGRALALFGAGLSLTPRVLGEVFGDESHAINASDVTMPSDSAIPSSDVGGARGLMNYNGASNHYHSVSYGTPFQLMQPSSFLNVMVRL